MEGTTQDDEVNNSPITLPDELEDDHGNPVATEKAVIVYKFDPKAKNKSQDLTMEQSEVIMTDANEPNPHLFNVGIHRDDLLANE